MDWKDHATWQDVLLPSVSSVQLHVSLSHCWVAVQIVPSVDESADPVQHGWHQIPPGHPEACHQHNTAAALIA